jgi:exopolysaccharide biosynthesis predicted pyruvyltransferase EpsI
VVQLPQSIHYSKKVNIETDQAIFASLPPGMFHLMVRTNDSVQFARQHFNTTPVYGSPDAAFAVGSWSSAKPSVDVLALLRDDHEGGAAENKVTTEWIQQKFGQHNLSVIHEDWFYPYHKSQESTEVRLPARCKDFCKQLLLDAGSAASAAVLSLLIIDA